MKMKKLMFALAVCAVCGIAQAATLKWSSGGNAVDGSGNLIASSGSDGKIVLALLGTVGNYSYDDAVAVQNGSWSVSSGKSGSSAKIAGTYTGGSTIDAYGTGTLAKDNVYAVMFQDKDGKLHQLVDGSGNAINNTYTIPKVPEDTDQFQFEFASGTVGATSASYGPAAPEPTSGILMLVGLGALALRRRKQA